MGTYEDFGHVYEVWVPWVLHLARRTGTFSPSAFPSLAVGPVPGPVHSYPTSPAVSDNASGNDNDPDPVDKCRASDSEG